MLKQLMHALGKKASYRVGNIAIIGLTHYNYDPKDFIIKGMRNVAIVDMHYLMEHHADLAKQLKESYPEN